MCLILAGKVGSNIASELGTMRVTQQIDALEIMGINSASYLILPKIVGLITIMPFLVIFSAAMGIVGAYATAFFAHIITPVDLTSGLQHDFNPWFMYMSITKSLFFAFIIASVSSFFGYTVKGGSVEVGKSSTNAVVSSSVLILFSDVFLTQLLFIMWYYAKVYGIKIKAKTMAKLVGFTVLFSQILVSIRSKKVFSLDLINSVYNFLFSQGVSYLVLGYTIDLKSKIVGAGSYPYILQGIFGFKPQSAEALNTTNSLADKLTYALNPVAYMKGEGIGSNYIAEMYDLGYVWIIVISILLGYMIIKYEKYVVRNRFLLLTSYYFIPNLFYIPRGSFFGEGLIKNMAMLAGVYILIFGFDYMYRKIEENEEFNINEKYRNNRRNK